MVWEEFNVEQRIMPEYIVEEQGAEMGNDFRWLSTGGKRRRGTSSGGTFGLDLSKGPIPFLISIRTGDLFRFRNVDGFVECESWRLSEIPVTSVTDICKSDGLFIFWMMNLKTIRIILYFDVQELRFCSEAEL
jgi:hypothetical protein